MTFNSTIKTGLRAGVVALALAGTALVGTAPVQAQSGGFSLNFGGGGAGFTFGGPKGNITLQFGDRDYFKVCLTNTQIGSALRNNGYRDIKIVRESNRTNKVWAVGRKGRDYFSMRVDRCTKKVDQIRKVDRRRDGSFNLSLSF